MEAWRLQQLREDRQEWESRARSLVLQAIADGDSRSWIHQQSGIARTTINRWLQESERK